MKSDSEDDLFLFEFHPLIYYCLKYTAVYLSMLYNHFDSGEFPANFLDKKDKPFWEDFVDSQEYLDLGKKFEDARAAGLKKFILFNDDDLNEFCLQKNINKVDKGLVADLELNFLAKFEGELCMALLKIERIEGFKKSYPNEYYKILADIRLGLEILRIQDSYLEVIQFQKYQQESDFKTVNVATFVKKIEEIV